MDTKGEGKKKIEIQILVDGQSTEIAVLEAPSVSTPKKCVFFLGICHLISCLLAVLTQIFLRYFHQNVGLLDPNNIGIGWYSGLIFGVTGGLGIYISQYTSKCSLANFLVMSILSSLMCIPLLLISVLGLSQLKTAHASIVTYLLSIQIGLAVLEAVVSIVSSCIGCQGTCCATSLLKMRESVVPYKLDDDVSSEASIVNESS